jgi:hypothetical protein
MLPTGALGNEIDGFRLGMSMDAARQMALEKGYVFGNGTKSGLNWISFVLAKGGPAISFCGDALSSVGKIYTGDLHELARLVSDWTNTLGAVEQATASQAPLGDKLFSQLACRSLVTKPIHAPPARNENRLKTHVGRSAPDVVQRAF